MKSATALRVVPPPVTFGDLVEPSSGQLPLPFGSAAVAPAPITRGQQSNAALQQRSAHLMQALVETLSGERPARQMATWMAPGVYEQLVRRLSARTRSAGRLPVGRRARVVSVHVAMIDPDTAELAARFVHAGRSRAIAVRLESRPNHRGVAMWQCTALTWA